MLLSLGLVVDIIHFILMLTILLGPYVLPRRYYPWILLLILAVFADWNDIDPNVEGIGRGSSCHLSDLANYFYSKEGKVYKDKGLTARLFHIAYSDVSTELINAINTYFITFNAFYMFYIITKEYGIDIFVKKYLIGATIFLFVSFVYSKTLIIGEQKQENT